MQAILALEDGRVFRGKGYGAKGECYGEVVFNTSITGYQEIFTDPSYAGQIVVLTNPEIGNYGTNLEDNESTRPYIEGLIVREFSRVSSNWRSQQVTEEFLEQFKIPVLADIDTRALVRHLRDHGVMRGVVSTIETDAEKLVAKANSIPKMDGQDLAKVVTTSHPYVWEVGERSHEPIEVVGVKDEPERFHVVAYDFGIKHNILRKLRSEACKVTVVPAQTPAEDVLALKPDGVFLSNGPGDPEPCTYAVDNIRRLMGRQPIFGICLGHQLVGIALGGKTFKLKFGHHGGNHPVKQLNTGKIEITAHNHNFAVDPDSLPQSEVELTHMDLNDQTLEGMRHRNLPLFTVQYHPEASPGPHDSHYLFKDFVKMMEEWKRVNESRISATVARLLMISVLFSLKALACTYFPPSYKVGNTFTVKVSSSEGATFAGVRVILLRNNTGANQALTNEAGEARFENVKSGDYFVKVDQLGTAGWDSALLHVVDGLEAKNINLRWPSSRILRATKIKGALLDSQTAEPVPGTSLQLVTALSGSLSAKLRADESGRFDLGSPQPGLYFIKVRRSGDRELLGSIPILAAPSGAQELTLVIEEGSCGMMYSEVCTAPPATLSQLRGSLSDEEGAVIDRAQVQLVAKSTNRAETRNTVPDQKGHFLIKDVEPGDYQLRITAAYFAHLVIPVTVAPNSPSDNSLDVRLSVLGGACSTAKVHQAEGKAN